MKAQILKIAGVKSEAAFYQKYPTEEAFFQAHPEAQMMRQDPVMAYGGYSPQSGMHMMPNGMMMRDSDHYKKGGSTYSGGVWFQEGGQNDDEWIRKMLQFEATKGSALGTGLSNYGYNSPRGYKRETSTGLYKNTKGDLYNGSGKWNAPKTIDEAVAQYKKEYLPDVANVAPGMRERQGDFLYNTGEDARLYQLDQYVRKYENMPNGLADRGQYRSSGTKAGDFGNLYGQYQSKIDALPMEERVKLMDQGRDYYYKNINNVNGQPSAAYNATWKPRLGMFGDYKAPQVQAQAVKAPAQQPVAPTASQPPRAQYQVQTAPSQTIKQPAVNPFDLPKLAALAGVPAGLTTAAQPAAPQAPAAAQPSAGINPAVMQYLLPQMQQWQAQNMAPQLGPVFKPQQAAAAPQQVAPTVTANPIPALNNALESGQPATYNWMQPATQFVPTPRQTIMNADGTKTEKGNFGEAQTFFQTDPKQTEGAPKMEDYLNKKPDTSKLNDFNKGLINAQDKMVKDWSNPYSIEGISGLANNIVQGVNNRKNYAEQKDKQRQRYSTDEAYKVTGTNDMSRGQYDMYGQMFPDQVGGNLSFNGMNQKYSFADGGDSPYETSGLSWIPKDLGPVGMPFINTMGAVAQPDATRVAAPREVAGNTGESSSDNADIKEIIGFKESRNNYGALPKDSTGKLVSSAVGKYQFLWNHHKDMISSITGIGSKEAFRKNPEAQEQFFDYWDKNILTPKAQEIKMRFQPKMSLNDIKQIVHFQGPAGASKYFATGKFTKDAFGSTPMAYLGKKYANGGEMELTEQEINQIRAMGGEVEFL